MAEMRDMANTPPTIYDVARAAGVSIASVSRLLTDSETRARKPGSGSCRQWPSWVSRPTARPAR